MTEINDTGFPNLANWAAMQDPDGGIAKIADVLSKVNPVLEDVPWVEGNLPTGHRITRSNNSLPTASWRLLNAGVAATKATTEQVDETCGIMESESKIDVDLAKLNGNSAAYRMAQDKLKMEGIANQFATALFYESVSSNPERIHGLTARYPATSGYDTSAYTSAGTNSGVDGQSVWLISWGEGKVYGIYPKGSEAGLQVNDKGEQRVLDSDSNAFYALCTQLQWKCGLAVEDYRYTCRHQYDPGDPAYADDDRGLYIAMGEMLTTIQDASDRARFYMSRTAFKKLNTQLMSNDANPLQYLSPQGLSGRLLPHFMGIPIRVTDALVAETAIS